MSTVAPGFRLQRMEVYNWGTFHEAVWSLQARGQNVLLTGDNGSGKSTFIDAITTLLVPAHRAAYNRAAGAETKERTLGSYVRGHYAATKSDQGPHAKALHLRTTKHYAILLGSFACAGLEAQVTIAQVYWFREEQQTQPERFYVIADADLSIGRDFGNFGGDIKALKRRLTAQGVQVESSYVEYERQICKRFGLTSQAIELFHQTVSMKAVDSLTEFVRDHMLEPDAIEPVIDQLIEHHDNLERSHQLVREAEVQISELRPIVAACTAYAAVEERQRAAIANRDHIPAWIATQWKQLIRDGRVAVYKRKSDLDARNAAAEQERKDRSRDRDQLVVEINNQGGHRLEQIQADIQNAEREIGRVRERRTRYAAAAKPLNLTVPDTIEAFLDQQGRVAAMQQAIDDADGDHLARLSELAVQKAEILRLHKQVDDELRSLGIRTTNIPDDHVRLRQLMCASLPRIPVTELPFAGELLRVREDQAAWRGAIERILRGFGISLLVPERHYVAVRDYIRSTHLGMRLDFYEIRDVRTVIRRASAIRPLAGKLDIQPGPLRTWMEQQIIDRFDYDCCETPEDYDRANRAVLRTGLMKGGDRHSKNDSHRIDDQRQYVLGWSNAEKVAALRADREKYEGQVKDLMSTMGRISDEQRAAKHRRDDILKLLEVTTFAELDIASWEALVVEHEVERAAIRGANSQLPILEERLGQLDKRLTELRDLREEIAGKLGICRTDLEALDKAEADCDEAIADPLAANRDVVFPRLNQQRDAGGVPQGGELTLSTVMKVQHAWSKHFGDQATQIGQELLKQRSGIIRDMQTYITKHHEQCIEISAATESAGEFTQLLQRLQEDDLPRFADRFKRALNENSIRDVVRLRTYLDRSRDTIRERVRIINQSLHEIHYNPGTYIQLDATESQHVDIRTFRSDLDACTSNTITGSDDDAYSEQKFIQVATIVERLKGRAESASADQTWRRLVTDVRNWYDFSALESRISDNHQVCYYPDSAGKSGGQKEKLAYTVLAASIAYQFGTESTEKPRTFRFVVIDEAFHRASDEYARYALALFQKLGLQLLIATPLQKIPIIEPFVSAVGFVTIQDGKESSLHNLTIEEHLRRRQQQRAS